MAPAVTHPHPPDYRAAVDRLAAHQKTVKGAPAYSRFVNRPLGRRAAAFAFTRGFTPDQVTAVSGLTTAAGIGCLAVLPARPLTGLVVSALLVSGYALDSADGQLARLRGGGSLAGEWLDHVVDAAKTVALHAAVLVSLARSGSSDTVLALPLAYLCLASTWFFAVVLVNLLRQVAATRRSGRPPVAAAPASLVRSLLALPTDYGVLCLVFLLFGWQDVFLPAYGLLFAGTALVLLAALPTWYRELSALDREASDV